MEYTIADFVRDLFDSCSVAPEVITLETAVSDLLYYRAAGLELPDAITPEAFVEAWNGLINSMKGANQ